MDKEKLHQYALNKISDKNEINEILNWIEKSETNQKEYHSIKNLLAYSGFGNYDSYVRTPKEKLKGKTIRINILKYAAIFIFAFLLGGISLYIQNKLTNQELVYTEIIVPAGESSEVILPDNTHVWLNSNSRMVYPTSFNSKTREVKLKGEAYFDVSHNLYKPFHVISQELIVEVIGTSFNIEAVENTGMVNVTLVEGKVNLKNKTGRKLVELNPNQNATYTISNKRIKLSNVDTEYYTSWKEGILMFKDEQLVEIAKKLERWYNVEIIFDTESIKEIKFTGAILKNKSLDQILDVLKYTSGIEYNIKLESNKPSKIHFKNKPMS